MANTYTLSPLDRAVISSILATELGGKHFGNVDDRNLILDVIFNRHFLGDATIFGSSKDNTLANIGLKDRQFSGLIPLNDLYNNPDNLTEEELIKLITANKAPGMSIIRNNSYIDPNTNKKVNVNFNKIIDDYIIDRMANNNRGIGLFPTAINFINPTGDKTGDALENYKKLLADPMMTQLTTKEESGLAHIPFAHKYHSQGQYIPQKNLKTMTPIDVPRINYTLPGIIGTQKPTSINPNITVDSNPPDVSNFVNFTPSIPTQSMSDQSNNILANMIPEIVSSGASPATFIPGQISNPMPMNSMVPPEFNKEPSAVEQIKNSIMSRFNRTMRGYGEYSDGTPEVPAFYAGFGSDFGPTHMQYLENAIESLRKRFPDASNEQIVNAIPDNIITDIRAQVKFDQDKAGKANTTVDPYETDTVPAMLTPGEAVIPAEAAQLKRNRAEIERMVREGREIQDRKEELNINPLDQSQNEKLADKGTSYLGILPPGNPLNKGFDETPPRIPQQYINDGSDINILQPGRTSYLGILPPDSPIGEPPMPQQYINDGSNVNIEKQLQMIPEDPDLTDKIDNDAARRKAEELIKANKEGKPSVPAGVDTSGIMGFFGKIGFTEQDIYRALLYYVGGRLTGGSHAGSLRWAGKQVLTEQSTRAKAAASAGSQALTYYRMRGEQMLKDGSLTIKGRRALTDALNKGNVQAIVSVMNDKENYSAIGQLSDLTKGKEYFSKTGYENNSFTLYPGYDGFLYKKLEDGKVVKINPDTVRPFSADIENNIKGEIERGFAGESEEKLKKIFGVEDKGDYSDRIELLAKKYNKPVIEVTTAMKNILSLTALPEKGKESEVRRSMEAALELTVLSPNKQVDVTKLANVNQSNINEMVKDFGGPEITTQILQNVDTELGGENITAATIDINRQEEEIKASRLTDAEKATIAKQPNPYFKGLYLHYFKNKDKYKAS